MIRNFIKAIGLINTIMLLVVMAIIVVAEITFLNGNQIEAIFIGLWAPTVLGFMIYLKPNK